MTSIMTIESISQVHQWLGLEPPQHPLISLVEPAKVGAAPMSFANMQLLSHLYAIGLKNGTECRLRYGRSHYDFQEGTLTFMAPGQVFSPIEGETERLESEWEGWLLLFHPDFIRRSPLAANMKRYSFFGYDSHEALHLSRQERQTITGVVRTIEHEYSKQFDNHTQILIISNLELLLNYCVRYYERQFMTREAASGDVLSRFEVYLKEYFDSGQQKADGLPTVQQCAVQMGYSSNYLSDLLKRETGKNTQELIHLEVIERAKTMLLATRNSVSAVAYELGFEYPQYFSKLFKQKTGMAPGAYRKDS